MSLEKNSMFIKVWFKNLINGFSHLVVFPENFADFVRLIIFFILKLEMLIDIFFKFKMNQNLGADLYKGIEDSIDLSNL